VLHPVQEGRRLDVRSNLLASSEAYIETSGACVACIGAVGMACRREIGRSDK
jgi:hypothetical protein